MSLKPPNNPTHPAKSAHVELDKWRSVSPWSAALRSTFTFALPLHGRGFHSSTSPLNLTGSITVTNQNIPQKCLR